MIEQRRVHQIHVNKEWNYLKKFLYGERGVWFDKNDVKERYWMLSDHENIHRMRCKLVENEYFDKHEESSRLRDNLSIEKIRQGKTRNDSSKNENKDEETEALEISNETQQFLSEEKEKL